ncbi:MAG: alpha/beta hydrolase, partial [Oscillospiraceae bacterium]|nr:alpha/beta hydrolase [Oscillospiraceae bacterium]
MEVSVSGMRVAYDDVGTGEHVLLLPGWNAPRETYHLLTDYLSGFCRVVVPDMPGQGETDEPPHPFCVDDYVQFVRGFIVAVGLSPVTVVGHSNGGRVLIKWLAEGGATIGETQGVPMDPADGVQGTMIDGTLDTMPEAKPSPAACVPCAALTVRRAVLLNSAGIKPRRSLLYYLRVYSYKAGKAFFSLPGVRALFPHAVERMRQKRGSADWRQASPVMRQTMSKCVNEDLTPRLKDIRVPVLLLWGEHDTATPLRDGRRMEKEIPDAGLVVLDGGHFAFAQQWG